MILDFSIIIPIYNRSQELRTILQSLSLQTDPNFQVIVADDASLENLSLIVADFKDKLNLKYVKKEKKSGCGATFNFGAGFAQGNYLISFDSDCIIPEDYIYNLRQALTQNYTDAYGGADASDPNFNLWQKAVSYSMTAFLTTGGLRGNKKALHKFQPRTYNMGVSKKVFDHLQGFKLMYATDIDFSLRLWTQGFSTQFIPQCTVFHKRRTSVLGFVQQLYSFGAMRPVLDQIHPQYFNFSFMFPLFFSLAFLCALFLSFFALPLFKVPVFLFLTYSLIIFLDSLLKNPNIVLACLAVFATYLQFFAYGIGYFQALIWLYLCKKNPEVLKIKFLKQ